MKERVKVKIGNEVVGDNRPAFIVAEAGINHNGDIKLAFELISKAKEAGANAVKFQAFQAEKLCDINLTETKDVEALVGSNSSYAMYKRLELSCDDIVRLNEYAKKEGIIFFLSVFDEERIDFLDSMGIPAYKISSGDLTHIPLIKYAAKKMRPMIISTGLADLSEVERAVRAIEDTGNRQIIILHCTADYPPGDNEINLATLAVYNKEFPYPIGFSDHSLGWDITIASAALRATMIEKHFTLDHNLDGPDHRMSLDAEEFKRMVSGIRRVELARGSSVKEPTPSEKNLLFSGRRGIKAACRILKGQTMELDKLKIVKPASGLAPEHLMEIAGKRAAVDIEQNTPIEWEMVERE